LATAVSGMPTP